MTIQTITFEVKGFAVHVKVQIIGDLGIFAFDVLATDCQVLLELAQFVAVFRLDDIVVTAKDKSGSRATQLLTVRPTCRARSDRPWFQRALDIVQAYLDDPKQPTA